MTQEKLREIIDLYRKHFKEIGVEPAPHRYDRVVVNRDRALAHVADMLPKMEKMLDEGKIEKFMRWLGFIQGVLWALGIDTIEELKDVNRPDTDPEAAPV